MAGFVVGAILCLAVVGLLAGCADTPRWTNSSRHPTPAQIQAVLGRLDTYIYFSSYQIYLNPAREQYTFWDGGAWVTSRELPPEVSMEALEASPSVAMTFDDAPARHHAEIIRLYPRNWGRSEAVMVSAQ